VELCYDREGDESDAAAVKKLLDAHGLTPSAVNAPLASVRRWAYGTFTNPEQKVRAAAVDSARETIEFARAAGAPLVNLWLGQDGFDYPFQADYSRQWELLVEGIRTCADFDPGMKVALEFKPREPRNRCVLDSASTALLLVKEAGKPNVGVTVDVGHVLQNGQNMARETELVARAGVLFNMHMNDNYAQWDDDMIVGSVHFIEFIELFHVLRKSGYDGWCAIDIFPYRENAFRATAECVEYMKLFDSMVDAIGMETIGRLHGSDAADAVRDLRRSIFGRLAK
jgi:xylose isomerase